MTRRLLVGVAETQELTSPRTYLVDLVTGLKGLGVEVQVAALAEGEVCDALRPVADVRVLQELPPRTIGGLAQAAARRIGEAAADRVHDLRSAADLRWLQPPDCVHLHGAAAAPVLGYVRDPAVPVTTYVHPHDFSIAGLSPRARARLVARTDRFLTGESGDASEGARASDHLDHAGVDPDRIEPAPFPLFFPPSPLSQAEDRSLRQSVGLRADAVVAAVPPVPDWINFPDLTISLAWELARHHDEQGPELWWYDMPVDHERRWPIDHDIAQLQLTQLHLAGQLDIDPVDVADVIVLPSRSSEPLPEAFLAKAAERATPVLCWSAHPMQEEVVQRGGIVVEHPDVTAMAAQLQRLTADRAARHEVGARGWLDLVAPVERITPLAIPAPRGHR